MNDETNPDSNEKKSGLEPIDKAIEFFDGLAVLLGELVLYLCLWFRPQALARRIRSRSLKATSARSAIYVFLAMFVGAYLSQRFRDVVEFVKGVISRDIQTAIAINRPPLGLKEVLENSVTVSTLVLLAGYAVSWVLSRGEYRELFLELRTSYQLCVALFTFWWLGFVVLFAEVILPALMRASLFGAEVTAGAAALVATAIALFGIRFCLKNHHQPKDAPDKSLLSVRRGLVCLCMLMVVLYVSTHWERLARADVSDYVEVEFCPETPFQLDGSEAVLSFVLRKSAEEGRPIYLFSDQVSAEFYDQTPPKNLQAFDYKFTEPLFVEGHQGSAYIPLNGADGCVVSIKIPLAKLLTRHSKFTITDHGSKRTNEYALGEPERTRVLFENVNRNTARLYARIHLVLADRELRHYEKTVDVFLGQKRVQ